MSANTTKRIYSLEFPLSWLEEGTLKEMSFDRYRHDKGDVSSYLEKASIPYVDDSGRFSDFHALRYTFNTWLHTNGVPQRMSQELIRHSDRRLTDQVYLDSSLLPLQDCMRSIGHKNKWTQKWTQISGETSQLASRVVGGDETDDFSDALYQWVLGEICRE